MKKSCIYTLFICLFCSTLSAQNKENLATLTFCLESAPDLKEKLSALSSSGKAVNIWILPPMGCPRCEGVMNIALQLLRKTAPDDIHVLWLSDFSKEDLKTYLKERNYQVDFIWDKNQEEISNYLSVNLGSFQTPHYLRFDTRLQKFTYQTSVLGSEISPGWVEQVVNIKEENILYANCNNTLQYSDPVSVSGEWLQFTQLDSFLVPGSIAEPDALAISADRSQATLIDRFSWDVLELNRSDKAKRYSMFDKINIDTFISEDVSSEVVLMLKKSGVLNTMLFCPQYIGNTGHRFFSASFAKLVIEDDAVGYYNVPVLISCSNKGEMYIEPSFNEFPEEKFSMSHTRYLADPEGKSLFISLSKGWPVIGTESSIEDANPGSPFRKDFYNNAPLFIKTDRKGNILEYAGKIEKIFSRLRTGYYYSAPSGCFWKGVFYYSTGFSGEIYAENNPDVPVFKLPFPQLITSGKYSGTIDLADGASLPLIHTPDVPVLSLAPDSQLNYILGFKELFKDCLTQFALNDTEIACLVYRDKKPRVLVYNRQSNSKLMEYDVPLKLDKSALSRVMVSRDIYNELWLDAVYTSGTKLIWASTSLK